MEESRKEYDKKKDHLKEGVLYSIPCVFCHSVCVCVVDNRQLQKEVSNKKQEAQALMAEMESIAQAFEEVQDQNLRLLEQLKVCYYTHIYNYSQMFAEFDLRKSSKN